MAAALSGLFLFDPLVIFTAGKTWNHELPALFLIASVCLHVAAARRDSALCLGLSGAGCGLAIGTRLTFLPCVLPLFALIFLFPGEWRRRWVLASVFAGAALVSLAPSLYFLATSPGPFLFDNLAFPRLRLLDPENTRIQKTMSLWRKGRFFLKEIVLPSWPVFVAFVAVLIPAIRRRLGLPELKTSGVPVVAWTALFLVIGCSLPSRYQYQHFFALIPLLLLGVALAAQKVTEPAPSRHWFPVLIGALAVLQIGTTFVRPVRGNRALPSWAKVAHREEWFPSEAARFGAEIRRHVPAGRILTLAPAWPLAGGLPIYPEFATGPFAFRSARFISADRRAAYHFVAPDDLPTFLERKPPGGILTGVEDDDLEAPLVAFAQSRGFNPTPLSRKRALWIPREPGK